METLPIGDRIIEPVGIIHVNGKLLILDRMGIGGTGRVLSNRNGIRVHDLETARPIHTTDRPYGHFLCTVTGGPNFQSTDMYPGAKERRDGTSRDILFGQDAIVYPHAGRTLVFTSFERHQKDGGAGARCQAWELMPDGTFAPFMSLPFGTRYNPTPQRQFHYHAGNTGMIPDDLPALFLLLDNMNSLNGPKSLHEAPNAHIVDERTVLANNYDGTLSVRAVPRDESDWKTWYAERGSVQGSARIHSQLACGPISFASNPTNPDEVFLISRDSPSYIERIGVRSSTRSEIHLPQELRELSDISISLDPTGSMLVVSGLSRTVRPNEMGPGGNILAQGITYILDTRTGTIRTRVPGLLRGVFTGPREFAGVRDGVVVRFSAAGNDAQVADQKRERIGEAVADLVTWMKEAATPGITDTTAREVSRSLPESFAPKDVLVFSQRALSRYVSTEALDFGTEDRLAPQSRMALVETEELFTEMCLLCSDPEKLLRFLENTTGHHTVRGSETEGVRFVRMRETAEYFAKNRHQVVNLKMRIIPVAMIRDAIGNPDKYQALLKTIFEFYQSEAH